MTRTKESAVGFNVPLWEDGHWRALPSLSGDERADVCVVGLGGSGLACASELLSLGAAVVGVDAVSVGGGASGRNGGFLRAGLSLFHHQAVSSLGAERSARLYRLTMSERDRMVVETPDAVRRRGYLRRAADAEEERDCRAHLAALHAADLPGEWYDGPEGTGVLVREDASSNPLLRTRSLAKRLMSSGARFYENSRAVSITGGCVETETGRVRCEAVVVAVDGGLGQVLHELADRARPVRLQMLATEPEHTRRFEFATGFRWGWDYWQQDASGCVALGGCRDVGGEVEWTEDSEPTALVQDALDRRLRDELGVHAAVTHRWAASVSYTDTGLPVLAEARARVWGVGAYSGTGNLLGAVAGRAAAQIALGRRSESPFA